MKRNCEYRNCCKDITEMRKDAKYCSRDCKGCENKYKKRRKEQLERYKEKDMLFVKNVKLIKEMLKGEDKN